MTLHNPTLRVIEILEYVDGSLEQVNLTEISKGLSIPKSTLSPIMKTLVEKGFLEMTNEGCYKVSFRLYQLGMGYSEKGDSTLGVIQTQMEELVKIVGELSQFGVRVDDKVLYLCKVKSENAVEVVSSVGKKLPVYCTGLGKVILSSLPDEKIREVLSNTELKKMGPNTITDIDSLIENIHEIRKLGYAMEREESMENVACIAVGIMIKNKIKGAISVTFPLFRDAPGKEDMIVKALFEKKKIIETLLRTQNLDLNWEK